MIDVILQYDFLKNALIAGVLVGLISPFIGAFLVVRRLSLIADALSHVTLSGVALGLFLQKKFPLINPLYTGMAFSVLGSFFVERLRKLYSSYQELAIPILLSGGIGFGVVFITATGGFNRNVSGYLFGNIHSVTKGELMNISVVSVIVLLFILFFYKELFILSFDEEHAIVTGVSWKFVNFVFTVVTALVVAVSMSVVGILLVSALMTIPVATSLQFTRGFKQTILWSVIFSEISVLGGLFAAYYFDLASGGTIVLVSILLLFLVYIGKQLAYRMFRGKGLKSI